MGKCGAGKTSMRSIIFANYIARDTRRLGPTMNVEHSYIRFLGSMVLNLWDCGGQSDYWENYLNQQKEQIFKGAEVLVYVMGLDSLNLEDDLRLYQLCLDCILKLSPTAKIFVLISKTDLLEEDKIALANELEMREKEIKKRSLPLSATCFGTSIWNETLYRAWSSIIHSLVPNIGKFQDSLNNFADIIQADEVLLFEKATYLVIAHSVRKPHNDNKRFEKVTNYIKQLKVNANRYCANLQSLKMEIIAGDLKCFLDILTANTSIMVVVTDPLVLPAAISLNIKAAKKHFEMLEKLERKDPLGLQTKQRL